MVKNTGCEVAREVDPLQGKPKADTNLSSCKKPQAMVHKISHGGGRGLEAVCSKHGEPLTFVFFLAHFPWHIPFRLESCIPQLNPRCYTKLP